MSTSEVRSPFEDPRIAFAATGYDAEPYQLFEEEQTLADSFSNEKRRREFLSGRCAAHSAIRDLSPQDDRAILRNPDRTPRFPDRLTGSISHSGGLSVAAVAWRAEFVGIGVDVQLIQGLDAIALERRICTAEEAAWSAGDSERLLRVFSAKEAVFKAMYAGFGRKLTANEIQLSSFDSLRWPAIAGPLNLSVFITLVTYKHSPYTLSGVAIPSTR